MGSCASSHAKPNRTVNKKIIRKPKPWKHPQPITRSQLMQLREEFWDTAPHYGGKKEIWDALRAAAETNLELAQAIVDSAGIIAQNTDMTVFYDESGTKYELPNTNGYTNIPQPNIDDYDEIVAMNLGFDPSKSSNYKIVCIVTDRLGLFRFFIFSRDTTTWKESGRVRGEFYFGRGVFLNGVIYLVSKHSHFFCFDLDNECLKIMPSTSVPEGRNGRKIKYFGESAGKLHLIEENVLRPTLLNVFELEKDYSKWFVKYVVDLDDLTRLFPLMVINEPESLDVIGYQFDVLCFVDGEKEGKTMLVLSLPEKIISYDIKNTSIKDLLKVPLKELHLSMEGFLVYNYKWYHAYKHIETLALV
ncbi:hypothetical protein K7X08_012232 [Anisodus acutangulus]|uniref:DC-UbP/UBTD2 N-terminal domain-containing protein n=1 Tax=Anisodus acutangulus TaxID=402998 RepID=A0A9Q1L9P7_9SOLA|nr:hypothetical protein K7X08_012232 [Anisodus acutangulus]